LEVPIVSKIRSSKRFASFLNKLKVATPVAAVIMVMSAQGAFAAATGITAIDGIQAAVTALVQGLAWFATIVLFAVLVWDFISHRNVGRSMFELLGVVLLGLIASNAAQVATLFNIAGATI
jgi:hypothetical protein